MKPEFYKAIDPVFLYVLEVVERMDVSTEPIDAEIERDKIITRLNAAEVRLANARRADDWELTKYALVAWIDELLASDLWESNSLEFEVFRTSQRSHEFFHRAEEAAKLPRKDALECFYMAVVLGFRGMYSSPDALEDQLRHLDFDPPATLEEWAKRMSSLIQVANDVPRLGDRSDSIHGAARLDGKYECLAVWSIATIVGFVAALAFYVKLNL